MWKWLVVCRYKGCRKKKQEEEQKPKSHNKASPLTCVVTASTGALLSREKGDSRCAPAAGAD